MLQKIDARESVQLYKCIVLKIFNMIVARCSIQ